jgi:hypothetical protein
MLLDIVYNPLQGEKNKIKTGSRYHKEPLKKEQANANCQNPKLDT